MKSIRWLLMGVFVAATVQAMAAEKGPDHSGKDLVGRDFTKQNLANATFEDSVCKGARFDSAILTNANFQGADLSGGTLANSDCTNADFRGALLINTSVYNATLNGANLEKQDLSQNGGVSYTKLRKANLRNLKAIGAVDEADFTEADLRGANLTGMKFVGGPSRFRKAKYDSKTRWPKGFDVEASGAILVEDEPEKTDDAKPKAEPKSEPRKEAPSKDLEKEFADLDSNEDGRLTGKEMKGLEDLDSNKDGRVSKEEFLAGKSNK
jgi:hypothetical protein